MILNSWRSSCIQTIRKIRRLPNLITKLLFQILHTSSTENLSYELWFQTRGVSCFLLQKKKQRGACYPTRELPILFPKPWRENNWVNWVLTTSKGFVGITPNGIFQNGKLLVIHNYKMTFGTYNNIPSVQQSGHLFHFHRKKISLGLFEVRFAFIWFTDLVKVVW